MVRKIFNELVVCMMAFVMLAPWVVFTHAVEITKTMAKSSKTLAVTPVYAKQTGEQTGESYASVSLYTIVNGKVVTDIHTEKFSNDGSAVSVAIESFTNGISNEQGQESKSPAIVVAKSKDTNDAAVVTRLKELITHLERILSLLYAY